MLNQLKTDFCCHLTWIGMSHQGIPNIFVRRFYRWILFYWLKKSICFAPIEPSTLQSLLRNRGHLDPVISLACIVHLQLLQLELAEKPIQLVLERVEGPTQKILVSKSGRKILSRVRVQSFNRNFTYKKQRVLRKWVIDTRFTS